MNYFVISGVELFGPFEKDTDARLYAETVNVIVTQARKPTIWRQCNIFPFKYEKVIHHPDWIKYVNVIWNFNFNIFVEGDPYEEVIIDYNAGTIKSGTLVQKFRCTV